MQLWGLLKSLVSKIVISARRILCSVLQEILPPVSCSDENNFYWQSA